MTEATAVTRDTAAAPSRTGLRRFVWLAVLLAAGAAIFALWRVSTPAPSARTAAADAIPVLIAQSTQADVPIYLNALGTVQAFNTVTLRAMVDGPLIEVPFHEGDDVHAGDLLAQIDPRTYKAALDQAIAKKQMDEAQLANARLDLARYQKLAATAYTSAQTADTQKAQVAQLEAQVAQDQAQIDTARTQLSYTTITAPIDGRIGMRQVDKGNIVRASDAAGMVVLTQLKPISVVFTLPQQSLPQVSAAMARGAPDVLALPQGGRGDVLDHGTLAVLDNQVDSATGTIKLKATFPNTDLKLWPGGFVGIRLHVDTQANAVTIPTAAVQRGPRGAYVYVVGADNTVTRRMVTVGHEDDRASIIEDGLKPGERVVTDGASRLTEGARVSISAPDPGAVKAGS